MIELIVSIVGFFALLVAGIIFGTAAERNHFVQLRKREEMYRDFIRTQSKQFIQPSSRHAPALVCAETVIANDYFKRFRAALRTFFGGEIKSYNSLMERARRETMMRIVEQAANMGFNAVNNVRIEPADVGGNLERNGKSIVCVVGSATAYRSELGK